MKNLSLSEVYLLATLAIISVPAHASGGGEILYLMFAVFALLPFAILAPLLAYIGYASAPEDEPGIARTRATIGALAAYIISYLIIYIWMVGGA